MKPLLNNFETCPTIRIKWLKWLKNQEKPFDYHNSKPEFEPGTSLIVIKPGFGSTEGTYVTYST